ncbi:MAG: YecA family protein, partial [Ilumatobacteraceae bacterium]
MPSPDAVRAAIVELLGTGARPRDEIVDALREADRSDRSIDERVARLLQRDTTFSEVADGVVYVPALLEGTTWTVHVDAADAAEGFVRSHLHLAPLSWWLIEGGVELVSADGDVLGDLSTDDRWIDDRNIDVVYGPPHWLDAVAGGWASVTVAGGAIRLAPLDAPPGPTRRQIDALRQGFERDLRSWSDDEEDGRPTGYAVGDGSVYEAVLIDRDAFVDSPVPALPDLYGAAGLEQRNGIIAPIGFDWDVLHAWQRRNMTKRMYGLDDEQADVLAALVGACDEFASEGPDALGSSEVERDSSAVLLSGLLDDGDVAAAFLEETERRGVAVEDVGRFADHLAERTDGSPASGVAWARARVREILGDSRGALALLEAAVGASCTHRPALLSLAGYASDRGDAPTAHRLLDRAGALDVEADDQEHEHDEACRLLDEVAPYALNRPRATAGRNEPCPCGSGRKYKACHLGREMHPLADRAKWLYDKAMRYARTNDHDTLREVADDLLSGDPWHVDELAESPFVGDLVLHHFDTFADFLEERSWLLPDDEAMLAAQWALVDSSVFEVVDIHHERVDVHDLRTGDDLTVVNL